MRKEASRSPLALMELTIMISVFAVAAVLCVRAFIQADTFSRHLYHRDQAVNRCQTVAETVKAAKGDLSYAAEALAGEALENRLVLYYNGEWEQVTAGEAVYTLCLERKETDGYVATAEVYVTEKQDLLFSLPVCWQEGAYERE